MEKRDKVGSNQRLVRTIDQEMVSILLPRIAEHVGTSSDSITASPWQILLS